jgi:Holliday junction resolvase RusA-like endonuclease
MPTHRRVDLVNLQEATLDVLVKYGAIIDDNSLIVASMDGSRVYYDKENPRTEIYIERV